MANNNKDEQIPEWKITREDLGLLPVPNEIPEWKVTKEDMGLVDIKDQTINISGIPNVSNDLPQSEIFGQGGTDFSTVLNQVFDDMHKNNPDTPKHVLILTDGDNGDTIESLTTTTYNEEQTKKQLKNMPETEFKEVNSNEPVAKKIDWKESLRKHLQSVEMLPQEDTLEISFVGIPKAENEPISKIDNIVLYSMEPPSGAFTSEETKEDIRKLLSERIKNVNTSLSSDNTSSNITPKLK